MKNSSRVVVNTAIVYTQLIINAILGLFVTRFVLQALGEEDYGVLMVVSGAVTMLAVLNGSMSNTAMRYMGHSLGEGDIEKTRKTFNTTLFIHIILGGLMIVILELAGLILFEYVLNIPEAKVYSAKIVYQFMIVSTFISIISVPYDAVINAHENLLFLSIVHVLDVVLKLLVAIYLLSSDGDKLIQYGFLTMLIGIVMRITRQIYSARHYKEVTLKFKVYKDKKLIKSILSFTGWEFFASVAAMCQGQLKAILMNMFFGVRLNTPEGIGNKVNSQVNMVSVGITRSITPQMNKAEGSGDRVKMLYLAKTGIKFTTFMFSLFALPLLIETEFILDVWLTSVPEYAVVFCQFCLIAQLLDKFTWQIGNAIRAAGRIKEYQIVSGTLPILSIIVSYFVFKAGYGPISIYVVNLVMLSILAVVRLYFGKWLLQLSPASIIRETTLPVLLPMLLAFGIAFGIHYFMAIGWIRLIVVFGLFMSLYTVLFYFFSVNRDERKIINNIIRNALIKIGLVKENKNNVELKKLQ